MSLCTLFLRDLAIHQVVPAPEPALYHNICAQSMLKISHKAIIV